MSKNVKIIISVVCLVLAAVIFCFTSGIFSGGGGGGGDGKIWFKCVNPDCNQPYSLTIDEFQKAQGNSPMMMPMMTGQQQAFKCQKCGQQSAYMAVKCGNPKCDNVFIMQSVNNDFPDRCPKCGYSAMEQSEKQ